jgi:hypothetical protein
MSEDLKLFDREKYGLEKAPLVDHLNEVIREADRTNKNGSPEEKAATLGKIFMALNLIMSG